jgi:hypothetical protein
MLADMGANVLKIESEAAHLGGFSASWPAAAAFPQLGVVDRCSDLDPQTLRRRAKRIR